MNKVATISNDNKGAAMRSANKHSPRVRADQLFVSRPAIRQTKEISAEQTTLSAKKLASAKLIPSNAYMV
jgi:hypothetical protein